MHLFFYLIRLELLFPYKHLVDFFEQISKDWAKIWIKLFFLRQSPIQHRQTLNFLYSSGWLSTPVSSTSIPYVLGLEVSTTGLH